MPEDDDTEGLKQTDRWRIIYVYIPGFIALLILFSMIFIIREDSIKFLISQGNHTEAKNLIRRLYRFASVPN